MEEWKERRAQLMAALRSGQYTQTTHVLRDTQGYCCLGVACDVAGAEWEWDGEGERFHVDVDHFLMPDFVKNWYGFNTTDGALSSPQNSSLSNFNDAGTSFIDIADLIESEPEGLFLPVSE